LLKANGAKEDDGYVEKHFSEKCVKWLAALVYVYTTSSIPHLHTSPMIEKPPPAFWVTGVAEG
jgi:hypothetical protein